MKRNTGKVTGNAVAGFLICEPRFPRSVRYGVRSAYERLCADASKARKLLGWSSAHADRDGLRRGIAETVAWLRQPEHLCLYKPDRYNV